MRRTGNSKSKAAATERGRRLKRGFLRAHRNTLVNPAHVRQVLRRSRGEDWELKLDPPVNLVLPVSRDALPALWAVFGEP